MFKYISDRLSEIAKNLKYIKENNEKELSYIEYINVKDAIEEVENLIGKNIYIVDPYVNTTKLNILTNTHNLFEIAFGIGNEKNDLFEEISKEFLNIDNFKQKLKPFTFSYDLAILMNNKNKKIEKIKINIDRNLIIDFIKTLKNLSEKFAKINEILYDNFIDKVCHCKFDDDGLYKTEKYVYFKEDDKTIMRIKKIKNEFFIKRFELDLQEYYVKTFVEEKYDKIEFEIEISKYKNLHKYYFVENLI
jgi:hypothetical protein